MLLFPPSEFRKRRGRTQRKPPSTPPLALTLVAATYDPGTAVELTFNGAIDIDAFHGAAVIVDDVVVFGLKYEGQGGAALLDPMTVRINLIGIGDPSGSTVTLTVSSDNGIVAANDGGTWAGVTNLSLPFP